MRDLFKAWMTALSMRKPYQGPIPVPRVRVTTQAGTIIDLDLHALILNLIHLMDFKSRAVREGQIKIYLDDREVDFPPPSVTYRIK